MMGIGSRWAIPTIAALILCCGERDPKSAPPDLAALQAKTEAVAAELVPVAALGADFSLRQHIEGEFQDQRLSLDCVLQKRGDTFTVVGLTPFGAKAFVVTQSPSGIDYEAQLLRAESLPPGLILSDLHRSLFWGLHGVFGPSVGLPGGGHRLESLFSSVFTGERSALWRGERVREHWHKERLLEREFSSAGGEGKASMSLRFFYDPATGSRLPARIELQQSTFGYRLTIRNSNFILI